MELKFNYHMYGAFTGHLWVDLYYDSAWHDGIWHTNGQQHSSSDAPFSEAVVDMSACDGKNDVIVRIRIKTGNIHITDCY